MHDALFDLLKALHLVREYLLVDLNLHLDGVQIVFAVDDKLIVRLKTLDLQRHVLVVDARPDKNLLLASRNVPHVEVTTSQDLNTYQVLRSDKLLFTKSAFEKVEARLTKE